MQSMFRKYGWMPAIGALALIGCTKTEEAGAICYPEVSRGWIAAAAEPPSTTSDPGGAYRIYLDGSGSMAGYIRGATGEERPLGDLIGMLPDLPTIDRSDVGIIRFDEEFTDLTPSEATASMGTAAGYGNRDSYIDQVLERIAKDNAQSLSVLVSDLWLVNGNVLTSGPVALSPKFSRIIASGRSIAIYGFEVPYAGRVSDLPSGNRAVNATRRHLFVLVAGPVARLQAFHGAMETASSPSIAAYMANGNVRYTLFTTDPSQTKLGGTQSFTPQRGTPLTKKSFLPARTGVRIPQYSLDKRQALRADGVVPGVRWQGVTAATMRPGAVWQGPASGATTVYREIGNDCAANGGDWADDGSLGAGWLPDGGFLLDPTELATLNSGRYLLVGALRRTDLTVPNPASQWMRDWSFSAASEEEAITRPVMPTLNLAELARLLEIEVQRSIRAKPVVAGGFAVVVEIE